MKIGYARISSNNQHLVMQIDALKKFGCKNIYKDTLGSFENRPKLELMQRHLNKGDIVVVWKLDRIAKSLYDLHNLFNTFQERKIDLVSIHENVDTSTFENRSFFEVISTIVEFEREIKSERVISGLEIANKRGKKGGRPKGLSNEALTKASKAKQLYEDDKIQVKEIATRLNIGKTTLYRYLRYNDENLMAVRGHRIQSSNKMVYNERLKDELFEKLIASKAFWSYSNVKNEEISDNILIQKVIENLDIPDIKKLFILYKKNHIRSVWKNELIVQEPYFRSLNILLAKLFFNIKNPESYIKHVRREHLKSVS